jgi:hypothetical protein
MFQVSSSANFLSERVRSLYFHVIEYNRILKCTNIILRTNKMEEKKTLYSKLFFLNVFFSNLLIIS